MRRTILTTLLITLMALPLSVLGQTEPAMLRTIQTRGTVELQVEPDEVHLMIRIREFYVEELAGKYKQEDLHKIVPLSTIEHNLIQALRRLGVSTFDISREDVLGGGGWRERGSKLLRSKLFNVTFSSMRKLEEVADRLEVDGIEQLYMGGVKSRQLANMRRDGMRQALMAAQQKAEMLAQSVNCTVGTIVSIVEIDGGGTDNIILREDAIQSSKLSTGADVVSANYRDLTLRFQVDVIFELIPGAGGVPSGRPATPWRPR